MKSRKRKNSQTIIIILFVIPFVIVVLGISIFCLLYSSLSSVPNEYLKEKQNIRMRENECTDDSDCVNGYCYVGKCVCYDGLSGEDCEVLCCEEFDENCTNIFENCTTNTIIFNTNCTVNETIINTNCTINETIINTNCIVNETIINTNCTVNETIFNPNCTCIDPPFNPNCTTDNDCKYNATIFGGDCYLGRCFCFPGFTGLNCDLMRWDLSSCPPGCFSGGVCVFTPPGFTGGECFCPDGTTGPYCSLIPDDPLV